MTNWDTTDIASQTGRTFVVTGANSGLGQATTSALAAAGARVVMAVRDTGRGAAAAAAISGTVEVRELDLADLASVRRFAADWEGPLDVLVNNAGVMAVPHGETKDGFELQLGTNHLGHFALTLLLLPHVTDRVVTVSSGLHKRGVIELDDLNWKSRPYNAMAAYAQSKLANLLFTLELERRLERDHSSVRSLASHPGYAATNLQGRSGNPVIDRLSAVANRVVAQSPADPVRGDPGPARRQLRRAGPDGRAAWPPDPRGADGRSQRPGAGQEAVGGLGGADLGPLPLAGGMTARGTGAAGPRG
jgi:NAD(P)-dependent dehydrogenase (short-subunit alcohol dehydrogenase family)